MAAVAAAGIAAAGSIAGGLMASSGGGGSDTSGASSAIQTGQQQSIAAQERMYKEALQLTSPWRQAGTSAVEQLAGLSGLSGYTALDPTAVLTSTPGYQFLQNQGTQALSRYGAATGLSASGAAMKGATNYGQQLAQTYAWNPYIDTLKSLSTQGLSGATSGASAAVSTGQGESSTYSTTANQLAQLQLLQSNAQNQQLNDVLSGLGYATSQLGKINYSSLGNLFGSGSMSLSDVYSKYANTNSNQAFNATSSGGWTLAM